jgi:trans-aconitate 2-methyltransferase
MWDAGQYLKYAEERSRPFFDLLAQVRIESPALIADLGCGPGNLTRILAERWAAARVLGVDSSPEMLDRARTQAPAGRVEFVQADIASWSPDQRIDLILSNAALQWVGDHEALLGRLAGMLAPGGALAVQMPYHFQNPAQLAIEAAKADGRWRTLLDGVGLHQESVRPLPWYVERLHDLGFVVDAWQTTYIHVLTGENPVLEWFKGSALRPLLQKLEPPLAGEFLDELGGRLRTAYPARAGVTLLPFPRVFFIGKKSTRSPAETSAC